MGKDNRHLTYDEIITIAKDCVGKTFGELGLESINKSNKGGLGGFVEENVFNYSSNNDNHPDFIDAGIELKVTPVKRNLDGSFSSKERLVLNMINYVDEVDKTFETSSFYLKNKKILVLFYLWTQGQSETSFKITNFNIFEFEHSSYFYTIKKDWNIIHQKIVDGKAHLISESDTTFLSACTKGANSKVLTIQPNSLIKAKPRAYAFKNGFMTRIYRQLLHEVGPYSSFISDDEWMKNTLEEIYKEKLSKYHGKTINEIKHIFHIKNNPKDITFRIAQKMLGLSGNNVATQEMSDANIKLKTVRLSLNGTPKESMSFKAFDFTELTNTPWEETSIREDFVDWKLMFFLFRENDTGEFYFDKVLFWNLPNSIVDGKIKEMYEKSAGLLSKGMIIKKIDSKGHNIDYFPKESLARGGNGVCHIRPHGRNALDTFSLPMPDKLTGMTTYTKQSFRFNKLFIKKIIEDLEDGNI